jgi:hypothetical protein
LQRGGRQGGGAAAAAGASRRSRTERFSLAAVLLGFLTTVGLGALLATVAQGLAAILSPRVAAGAVPLAVTLLLVTASYGAGGYVAGRIAGRAGARHGFGVWIAAVLLTLVLGALTAVTGTDVSVAERFGLPQVDAGAPPGSSRAVGVSLLVVLLPLLAAMIGGRAAAHER